MANGQSQRPEEEERLAVSLGLDPHRLPLHIAIIMDGNRRWAEHRGLSAGEGHRAGAESLRDVVRFCGELGIPFLTVYAFSTENWKRPEDEVQALMHLLVEYLAREVDELDANGVRVRAIGRLAELPAAAQLALAAAEDRTAGNGHLTLTLALNYGGRAELVDAARRLAADAAAGRLYPQAIDEETLSQCLYAGDIPDPDLLIRPAGEFRVSNFLLWQIAYAEFWVTPVLWPDFRRQHLTEGLLEYQRRERRFGGRTKC
ncbi:MAG: isoprenyl transferase [Thermoanaerobacterales bacterium]|nr:isoprenyl transferase [Bacillota bacterium]MDI6907798.1 isoprenyl transferase [Thermoanaerobacterales bacterium]